MEFGVRFGVPWNALCHQSHAACRFLCRQVDSLKSTDSKGALPAILRELFRISSKIPGRDNEPMPMTCVPRRKSCARHPLFVPSSRGD